MRGVQERTARSSAKGAKRSRSVRAVRQRAKVRRCECRGATRTRASGCSTEAARLFAARGFARVTVRDICRAAHANVAAINYHFHGKRGLYDGGRAVGDRSDAHDDSHDHRRPAAASRRSGSSTTFVAIFLQRVTAMRDNWIHQLMMRELNEPTAALDLVVRQVLEPRMTYLGERHGRAARLSEQTIRACGAAVTSVQLQCLAAIDRGFPLHSVPTTPAAVAELADHIARFSIGGITALRGPAPRRSRHRQELAPRHEHGLPADLYVRNRAGRAGNRHVDAAGSSHLHALHVRHLTRLVAGDTRPCCDEIAAKRTGGAAGGGILEHAKTGRKHPAVRSVRL